MHQSPPVNPGDANRAILRGGKAEGIKCRLDLSACNLGLPVRSNLRHQGQKARILLKTML